MAQQHVIVNKDNTRPEVKEATTTAPSLFSFTAKRWNGYNEIEWQAGFQEDTKTYIVEYSSDGINFQFAGEVLAGKTTYRLKHYFLETVPVLYRIQSRQLNGMSFYSPAFFLEGIEFSPVKVYPTVITTNAVNVMAHWPVERIRIFSTNGIQVFAKEINGKRDYISIVLPALAKGVYYMTFYGNDWKTTEGFIIG